MNIINRRDLALLEEKFSGEALDRAKQRVVNGEPLAYVLGEWFFYGLAFKLNDACLIPRPDTEHIVDKAIELIPKNTVIADLCTGSGCIAISILKHRADLTCVAVDISEKALAAAKENARANGVSERVRFVCADLLTDSPTEILGEQKLGAVVSNPPYICTDVIPSLETVRHEPIAALDGGDDGLAFYRALTKDYKHSLDVNGVIIFEIGYDQARSIKKIADGEGFSCSVFKDYGQNDRVAVLTPSHPSSQKELQ